MENLGKFSSLFRKYLRVGKYVHNANSILSLISRVSTSLDYSALFKSLSLFSELVYFFVDHVLFLSKIGSIDLSSSRMNYLNFLADLLWFFESLFAVISDIIDFIKISQLEKEYSHDEIALAKIRILKKKKIVNSIRVWGDSIVRALI